MNPTAYKIGNHTEKISLQSFFEYKTNSASLGCIF